MKLYKYRSEAFNALVGEDYSCEYYDMFLIKDELDDFLETSGDDIAFFEELREKLKKDGFVEYGKPVKKQYSGYVKFRAIYNAMFPNRNTSTTLKIMEKYKVTELEAMLLRVASVVYPPPAVYMEEDAEKDKLYSIQGYDRANEKPAIIVPLYGREIASCSNAMDWISVFTIDPFMEYHLFSLGELKIKAKDQTYEYHYKGWCVFNGTAEEFKSAMCKFLDLKYDQLGLKPVCSKRGMSLSFLHVWAQNTTEFCNDRRIVSRGFFDNFCADLVSGEYTIEQLGLEANAKGKGLLTFLKYACGVEVDSDGKIRRESSSFQREIVNFTRTYLMFEMKLEAFPYRPLISNDKCEPSRCYKEIWPIYVSLLHFFGVEVTPSTMRAFNRAGCICNMYDETNRKRSFNQEYLNALENNGLEFEKRSESKKRMVKKCGDAMNLAIAVFEGRWEFIPEKHHYEMIDMDVLNERLAWFSAWRDVVVPEMKFLYYNCDTPFVKHMLGNGRSEDLKGTFYLREYWINRWNGVGSVDTSSLETEAGEQ
jgi:hypothetical protein